MEAALRGPAPAAAPAPAPAPAESQADGTAATGYATPDLGPFECDNCVHFDGTSRCDNPDVINDPEVQGNVDAEGCCNLFKSAHKESQESEHSEGLGGDSGV